jgi:hypothetical protein
LQSCYELENHPNKCKQILDDFEKDCEKGVSIARKCYKDKILQKYLKEKKGIEYIFNKITDEI